MEPIERGQKFGRVKVVSHTHRGYLCRCNRCDRLSTIAARSLRLKREPVQCRHCFPPLKQTQPEVIFSGRSYAYSGAA